MNRITAIILVVTIFSLWSYVSNEDYQAAKKEAQHDAEISALAKQERDDIARHQRILELEMKNFTEFKGKLHDK